jgi:membrane-associated phospholipid phosphatase
MILTLSLALGASLVAFAYLVADHLKGDAFVGWDIRFAVWLHERSSGPLLSFSDVATLAGDGLLLSLVVAAAAVVWIRHGRPNNAAALVIALAGTGLLNAVLKRLLEASPPHPTLAFMDIGTRTFPSGHAAGAAAVYGTLAFLLGQRARGLRPRVLFGGAAFTLIGLVGFSRISLGTHYLSDVLGGACFGIAWATVCLLAHTAYGDRSVLLLMQRLLARLGPPTREP